MIASKELSERWLSGRKRPSRKRVSLYRDREFESHPLRQQITSLITNHNFDVRHSIYLLNKIFLFFTGRKALKIFVSL